MSARNIRASHTSQAKCFHVKEYMPATSEQSCNCRESRNQFYFPDVPGYDCNVADVSQASEGNVSIKNKSVCYESVIYRRRIAGNFGYMETRLYTLHTGPKMVLELVRIVKTWPATSERLRGAQNPVCQYYLTNRVYTVCFVHSILYFRDYLVLPSDYKFAILAWYWKVIQLIIVHKQDRLNLGWFQQQSQGIEHDKWFRYLFRILIWNIFTPFNGLGWISPVYPDVWQHMETVWDIPVRQPRVFTAIIIT